MVKEIAFCMLMKKKVRFKKEKMYDVTFVEEE